jgi:hypothetical protein
MRACLHLSIYPSLFGGSSSDYLSPLEIEIRRSDEGGSSPRLAGLRPRSLPRMSIIMLVPSALQQWGRASPASCRCPGAVLCATIEEYEALSGVWRTELELNDGDATISLHLATPESLSGGSPGGKVHTLLKLPFNILKAGGRQSASWSIHPTEPQHHAQLQVGEETRDVEEEVLATGPSGQGPSGQLGLSLQLGTLQLEGRGERRS